MGRGLACLKIVTPVQLCVSQSWFIMSYEQTAAMGTEKRLFLLLTGKFYAVVLHLNLDISNGVFRLRSLFCRPLSNSERPNR